MACSFASTASSAIASKAASNLPLSCNRYSSSKLPFSLPPVSRLRFLTKGSTSSRMSYLVKAQLNEVRVDNSSIAAANQTKSEVAALGANDAKPSSKPSSEVLATEESMSEFITQVASLIKLVDSRDIVELQLKQLDCEVTIRKKDALSSPAQVAMVHSSPSPLVAPATPASTLTHIPAPPTPTPSASPPALKSVKSSHPPLKCPMAGTFYRSPAPGEPPFVKWKSGPKIKEMFIALGWARTSLPEYPNSAYLPLCPYSLFISTSLTNIFYKFSCCPIFILQSESSSSFPLPVSFLFPTNFWNILLGFSVISGKFQPPLARVIFYFQQVSGTYLAMVFFYFRQVSGTSFKVSLLSLLKHMTTYEEKGSNIGVKEVLNSTNAESLPVLITRHRLNGNNYRQWSHSVMMYTPIEGRKIISSEQPNVQIQVTRNSKTEGLIANLKNSKKQLFFLEIESVTYADQSGTVVEILVEDGKSVSVDTSSWMESHMKGSSACEAQHHPIREGRKFLSSIGMLQL
ncbi:biotin carboxyl carrier protein of acetyl-CoA carboxylase, chloroplastic-like isoform X2 [Senna tora]|uniref:Biotin carboxyl carrier protein of acetyl-CoA carboxylase, chloroplastic-like isoform X2 n=1 Tax=Senna tora TaxID=362788 RepID=A0A834SKF1_9FABA|nr:biotin carboxyl carrier protein of acetyl-CoA carboxylase, chloroplastic-like isoform X2 [Senna tora]